MKLVRDRRGFTIVELLIVIVIIGILATIVIVAYNGITTRSRQATLQSDLTNSRIKVESANVTDGSYPTLATVNANRSNYIAQSSGNTLVYNTNPNTSAYCISATGSDSITYVISNRTGPTPGYCSTAIAVPGDGSPLVVKDGVNIQDITNANCPTTRTRTKDARDNHTYWVSKIGSLCWMMTNLAYGGGGNNTYGDVIPTGDGSNGTINGPDNAGNMTYELAKYYTPTGSNVTTEPTNPSISTDGTGQYGYLYNGCAAMGAQSGTSPCKFDAHTDDWDHDVSICPTGWRLPVGNGGDFTALNNAVNGGSTTSDSGLIGAGWLGQRSGMWGNTFADQGRFGYYWSGTSDKSYTNIIYYMNFGSGFTNTTITDWTDLVFAVRCVAAI